MTTVAISLTTLSVGDHVAGPATLNGTWDTYSFFVDRTVANGLDSLTSATHLAFSVQHSTDAGQTWRVLATGGQVGGTASPDGSPGISGDFTPPLAAGLVQVIVTVIGTPVAVAGTLTVT